MKLDMKAGDGLQCDLRQTGSVEPNAQCAATEKDHPSQRHRFVVPADLDDSRD